jgi:predicted ATPase
MIRNLHVQNFKSFKDVSIDMGRLNVLVGPNMSGKSNLIDVFRLLSRTVAPAAGTYGLPNAILSFGRRFEDVAWKGADSKLISIGLEGEGWPPLRPEEDAKWSYRIEILGDRHGGTVVQEESLKVFTAEGEKNLINNAGGRRQFANLKGTSLGDVGFPDRSALEFERTDWEGNALREYILKWRFYSLIPSSMRGQNQSAAAPFLLEHGENFSSWLMTLQTRHDDEFERIARVARDVFPELEKLFTQPTQQGSVFAATREKCLKRTTSINQMSDGELVFIALLSLIYSPLELASPFLLIEEAENHLHLRLLVSFVELLKQVQQELPPARCPQVIMTTHSPHLIDQFDLDELIVLGKREGATSAARPGDKEDLRKLLEEKEIGLGSLYYSGALGGAS